jgi:hypothetical protein
MLHTTTHLSRFHPKFLSLEETPIHVGICRIGQFFYTLNIKFALFSARYMSKKCWLGHVFISRICNFIKDTKCMSWSYSRATIIHNSVTFSTCFLSYIILSRCCCPSHCQRTSSVGAKWLHTHMQCSSVWPLFPLHNHIPVDQEQ